MPPPRPPAGPMPAWFFALFVGLFLLVGAIPLTMARWMGARAVAARSWSAAPGTITRSEMTEESYYDRRESRYRTYQRAQIAYAFQAGGRSFTGTRVSATNVAPGLAEIARYPVGSAVTVYYDPQNPELAALDNHPSRTLEYVLTVAGVLVSLGSVPFVFATVRALRRNRRGAAA